MEILVCVKQVPGSSDVEIDQETGVLKRDGAEAKMNPFDLYALETALQIREQGKGTVKALTMGPPDAAEILKESFAIGADDAVLLSDKAFAGSDVLSTAYTISQGIRKSGSFDLIICGKQTTDGDTAQVGPELAEFLGIPHITNVSRIAAVNNSSITVETDLTYCIQTVEVEFPCLITVEPGVFMPRLPSFIRKRDTSDREIRCFSLKDLYDSSPDSYGLNGSATQVISIFPPETSSDHELWTGDNRELSEKLYSKLKEKRFLQDRR